MEKITSIQRYNNVSKTTGKPYESVVITVDSQGMNKIKGFGSFSNKHWKVGDNVNITISSNSYGMEFKEKKASDELADRIKMLETRVSILESTSTGTGGLIGASPSTLKKPSLSAPVEMPEYIPENYDGIDF